MSADSAFAADRGLLVKVLTRDAATEIAAARAAVASWAHGRGNFVVRGPLPFERERDGALGAKLKQGRPEAPRDEVLVGLDEAGRAVLAERVNDEGEVWAVSAYRHDDTMTTGVTYDQHAPGQWRPTRAALERWQSGHVCHTASLFDDVVLRTDYLYDEAGRVVEIVERRSAAWDAGHREQRVVVEYGDDGRADALIQGGQVLWRRRARRKDIAALARRAEDGLTRDLLNALRQVPAGTARIIALRHQRDGTWTDQCLPAVAITAGQALDGEDWEAAWETERWDVPDLSVTFQAPTLAALAELDDLGNPEDDAPRNLLRIVARRVATSVAGQSARPVCVVLGFDPEDLEGDIARATTPEERDRLRQGGYLPS